MSLLQTVIDLYAVNLNMLNMHLADLTEAEMLIRPVPGANNAAWQLGHMAVSETRLGAHSAKAKFPEFPAGFVEKFSKATAGNDTPGFYPGKEELLSQFGKVRAATIEWLKVLTPEDLAVKIEGNMAKMMPTVGHVVLFIPSHVNMHVGQFQVLRRKLGKPVMF